MQNDFYLAMPSLQGLREIPVLKSQLILLLIAIYETYKSPGVPDLREDSRAPSLLLPVLILLLSKEGITSNHQRPSSKHCKHYLLSFSSFSLVPCSNS